MGITRRFLFISLVLIMAVPAPDLPPVLGQTPEKAKVSNQYVRRLEQARDGVKKGSDKQESPLLAKILLYYDYAIENAVETLSEGGAFGKEEYDEAMAAIRKESDMALKRRLANSTKYDQAISKAEREFGEKMRDLQKEREARNKVSQDRFQRSTAIANLRFKFTTNRGDLGFVIWNLPSKLNLHDRSTLLANVQLFSGDKVVWAKKGLRLSRDQPRNPMLLPKVMFDRMEIEIPKWMGEGSGLAEVEIYIGKENVALGRPCTVSSLETDPKHLDDQNALTDGVTVPTQVGEGYWIPEAQTIATVSIDLLGPKHDQVRPQPRTFNQVNPTR